MPLLLNVLRNANATDHKKLRWKAMECAGLIGQFCLFSTVGSRSNELLHQAIAVGRDVFKVDAKEFIELLMRIQSNVLL